jgi:hypothetical protein
MAEEDTRDSNLPPRDFVDALVEDPANPPQLQVILGYRGRSAQEGQTRFYADLALSAWADVPDDAILFQREVKDELGFSRSLVWARLDAQIQVGPQAGGGTGAEFLQGQVAQDLGANLRGGGGIEAFVTAPQFCRPVTFNQLCPSHFIPTCPQSANFCISQILCPTRDLNQCVLQTANPLQCPSLGFTCTALAPCPTRDPNQCVLQTADPQQCPSLGFTCTALPPCPPRTATPEQCPTLGITCTALAPCPTRDPNQCVLQTANQQQCPSVGITCTALPPCPPQPPVPPPSPFIGCIPSFQLDCPPATRIPQLCGFKTLSPLLCGLQTVDVVQCIPKPSSNPQLCPVATPNAVCIPNFPGGPGGGFQGAEGMGVAAVAGPGPAVPQTLSCPSQVVACTQFCPAPNTTQLTCPVTHNVQCFTSRMCPRSTFCPSVAVPCQTGPVCQPVTLGCPFGGGGGFGGGF